MSKDDYHSIYSNMHKAKEQTELTAQVKELITLISSIPNDQDLGREIRKVNINLLTELINKEQHFS